MEWFISYTDLDGIDAIDFFNDEEGMSARLQALKRSDVSIWSYGQR